MSDDSKYFEKKLDKDFLEYLTLTKKLFDNLKNDTEKSTCELWLNVLLGKPFSTVADKCNRNIFLSRLLLQMQNGRLKGIFLDTPPSGPLPCAFSTFNLPSEVDGLKGFDEFGFQVDQSTGGGSGDFLETSRDGRTYLATRRLPEGMMAYMAVTNNEGEEIWVPQVCAPGPSNMSDARPGPSNMSDARPGPSNAPDVMPGPSNAPDVSLGAQKNPPGGFIKKLAQYVKVPISQLRRSPEEREKVIEWMDKIISDCNSWLRGEDPHNMDLEALFEILYDDYRKDPEKAELLKHPRTVRNILFKDIRDMISERRAEVTKRERVLDQYEADEYVEERVPKEVLDEVWLECAKKPIDEPIKKELEHVYPPELVQRFNELLFQERLQIIEKGEREANKKIAELRAASIDDIKKELSKLKKVQDDYKEYYCIYREVEQRAKDAEKEFKEKCGTKTTEEEGNADVITRELETEIEQAKQRFEKERRMQNELEEKLEEANEAYNRLKEKMAQEAEKLNCERNKLRMQKEEILNEIVALRNRRDELQMRSFMQRSNCRY